MRHCDAGIKALLLTVSHCESHIQEYKHISLTIGHVDTVVMLKSPFNFIELEICNDSL